MSCLLLGEGRWILTAQQSSQHREGSGCPWDPCLSAEGPVECSLHPGPTLLLGRSCCLICSLSLLLVSTPSFFSSNLEPSFSPSPIEKPSAPSSSQSSQLQTQVQPPAERGAAFMLVPAAPPPFTGPSLLCPGPEVVTQKPTFPSFLLTCL